MEDNLKKIIGSSLIAYTKSRFPAYKEARHAIIISNALEEVAAGRIKRLIIEAPPRHGKSILASENFPAWYLGRNPSHEVIFGTYNQKIASGFGRKVRNQLDDPMFGQIFPDCHLSTDSKSKHQFNTLEKGQYLAIGVGGGATGFGAHLVILDDTLKGRKQAESETYRQELYDFYKSTIYTRLTPDGAVVIMQARWHPDDLIGYVLKEYPEEDWHIIKLPAVNEEETTALWPERYSLQKLMKIKGVLGDYDWNALYLCRPGLKEGNILKRTWWKYYSALPHRFDRMVQSWDCSFKDGEDTSFVVGQVWGQIDEDYYLVYQYRKRMGIVDTMDQIRATTSMYPSAISKYIEDKANGSAIIELLNKEIDGIEAIDPKGASKESRAMAITPLIKEGHVYLPSPEVWPWVSDFLDRCDRFRKGSGLDDEIDAMSQALSQMGDSALSRLEKMVNSM